MNTIGSSAQTQILVPSHTPLGKPVAGLESAEKDQTLPPVEESSAAEKTRNQPHQKLDAVASDGGDRRPPSKEEGEGEGEERSGAPEALVSIIAESAASAGPAAALTVALQRAATLSGEHHKAPLTRDAVVDSFSAAAGEILSAGILLDQRS